MTFTAMGNWGFKVSLEELQTLPEPSSRGARHFPIPHSRIVDITARTFDMTGYELSNWEYYLSNDNQRMLAGFEIRRPDLDIPQDWSFTGGIMSSTNSTISAKLLFGSNVGVCDNGCIWAEFSLRHKHTTNAISNLKYMILDRIADIDADDLGSLNPHGNTSNLRSIVNKISNETQGMKSIVMDDAQTHDFLVTSCKNGVLKWQHAPLVLEQWNTPAYDEFSPRTQWSLFNGYTHVWKEQNQFDLSQKTNKLLETVHDWNNEEFVGQQTSEELYDNELEF